MPQLRLPSFWQQKQGQASDEVVYSYKNEFPARLCSVSSGNCLNLATVGTRQWKTSLPVKIYDFALYVDPSQTSRLARKYGGRGARSLAGSSGFYQQLKASDDLGMSVVVRTSRSLPVHLLTQEYQKSLRKRLGVVGGNPDDPKLGEMMAFLDEGNLPTSAHAGRQGHMRSGTWLVFTRGSGGQLYAQANTQQLGNVRSGKLCEALFDMFLGQKPVCTRAKKAAAHSMHTMLHDSSHTFPQGRPGRPIMELDTEQHGQGRKRWRRRRSSSRKASAAGAAVAADAPSAPTASPDQYAAAAAVPLQLMAWPSSVLSLPGLFMEPTPPSPAAVTVLP